MSARLCSHILTLGLLASGLCAAEHHGSLAPGDGTLPSGEYYEILELPVERGVLMRYTMASTDLDCYLIADDSRGAEVQVDDSGGVTDASLEMLALADGQHRLVLTTARPGEQGAWRLTATELGRYRLEPLLAERGDLAAGDRALGSGEFVDDYAFAGAAGQRVAVSMAASDFKAYVMLRGPNGEIADGDGGRVDHVLESAGEWRVYATSGAPGATGAYDLVVHAATPAAAAAGGAQWTRVAGASRSFGEALAPGDDQLDGGEYLDHYFFPGTAGQTLTASMRSTELDAYLVVVDPSGQGHDNDDAQGRDSRLQLTADRAGVWRVLATSSQANERGAYTLTVDGLPAGGATSYVDGSLAAGDQTLSGGEFVDRYRVPAVAGQRVSIMLAARSFDPYLIVTTPEGQQFDNDDGENMARHSHLDLVAQSAGEWDIVVTSYAAGETGGYRLFVHDLGAGAGGNGAIAGVLEAGDTTLSETGEWYDSHEIEVAAGEEVVIEMRSEQFDPYLIVTDPAGEQHDNDDYEGSRSRSLISFVADRAGTVGIHPTSYAAGQGGAYTVTVTRIAGAGAPVASEGPAANTVAEGERVIEGTLATGDQRLGDGDGTEYYDMHTFEGAPGRAVQLRLTSDDFDPYLIVLAPSGEQWDNDDFEGLGRGAGLDLTLGESGTYRVLATSYAVSTGAYRLVIDQGGRREGRETDVMRLSVGEQRTERLATDDQCNADGRYVDGWVFEGRAGQEVLVDLYASGFDGFLGLEFPDGRRIENDDFNSDRSRSRVEARLPENGRYRVFVTSYAAGETGEYRLVVGTGEQEQRRPIDGSGRYYGVFVGLSDYPGESSDLPYCAEDATRMHAALVTAGMMAADDAVVLTDRDATVANVRAALREVGTRCGADDTFVFFFSGHGSRHDRDDGPQPTDPDAVDESLIFYDGLILDDDMHTLLSAVPAGVQFIAIDSCFSGGFSKDLICVPGRMGMFSSEEDVPSNVAAKFRAGGYLSVFLIDGVRDMLADGDADGSISVLELSQYVHERYRNQVKSGTSATESANFVREADLGYQHLVVDRGSIRHDFPLFTRSP